MKRALSILILLLAGAASVRAQQEMVERIVARVNVGLVTHSDYD